MHTYVYIHTYIHTYIQYIYIHTHIHTRIRTKYIYIHTHIHTRIRTKYIHTHTYINHYSAGYLLRGLNCALRTGEGNRNLYSHSPDSTSHKQTFQSVDELNNFRLLLLQLKQNNKMATLMYVQQLRDSCL